MATESCIACGEETGIGSVFYSDRRVVDLEDGQRTFMCSLCEARFRMLHEGGTHRLTDEQVRNLVRNGSMAAIAWGPPHLG
jgi:transcription elongation factor Elf1